MAFQSKQNIDSLFFRQTTGSTITLSGDTIINGTIRYSNGFNSGWTGNYLTNREYVDGVAGWTVHEKFADHTMDISDAFTAIMVDTTGDTFITIPMNVDVPFNIGTIIKVHQYNFGNVTIVADGDVVIRKNASSLELGGRHAVIYIAKIDEDEWFATGDFKTILSIVADYLGVDEENPNRKLHATEIDTNNFGITNILRLTHGTSLAPSAGIGTGIEFETQTSTTGLTVGSRVSSISTSVTGNNKTFKFGFQTVHTGGTLTTRLEIDQYGAKYPVDYSSNFTARSLVDKDYVDNTVISNLVTGVTASNGLTEIGGDIRLGGDVTGETIINSSTNSQLFIGGFGDISNAFYDIGIASINNTFLTVGTGSTGLNLSPSGVGLTSDGGLSFGAANGGFSLSTSEAAFSGGSTLTTGYGGFTLSASATVYPDHYSSAAIQYETNVDRLQIQSNSGYLYFGDPDGSDPLVRAITIKHANTGFTGIKYYQNYASGFTSRSLVDKGYVTGITSQLGGGSTNVEIANTTFTATTATNFIGLSGTTSLVYLPASPTLGQKIYIKDIVGDANANPVTVNGNGKNIDGSSTALINSDYGSISIIWYGKEWSVLGFI